MIGLIKGTARQLKTVSGLPLPIASYKSNSKLPIQELSLSINPTQSGSGDPAPDNIRPITGVSSVNVARTGKNLSPTQPINYTATNYGVILFWVKAGTYTASYTGGNCQFYVRTSTPTDTTITSGTEISHSTTYRNDYTFTVPSDGYYKVQLYRSSGSPWSAVDAPTNFQIEIGNQPSSYEPYTGNTYLIQLGDTYYGATLDVVRGKLRVINGCAIINVNKTHNFGVNASGYGRAEFSMTSLGAPKGKSGSTADENVCDKLKSTNPSYSWNYGNKYSCAIYTEGTGVRITASAAENTSALMDAWLTTLGDIMLIYPLATPIEIDLTPTQVNSLLGQNHIWHDANGDVEVLKFMDRQLFFGR